MPEKLDDIKGIIRGRKSKTDRSRCHKAFSLLNKLFLLKSVFSANQIWVFPYLRIFSDLSKFSSFVVPGPDNTMAKRKGQIKIYKQKKLYRKMKINKQDPPKNLYELRYSGWIKIFHSTSSTHCGSFNNYLVINH